MKRTFVALAALLALSACSTEEQMLGVDSDADPSAGAEPAAATAGKPTAVPAADGPVTTDGLVTVLDDGDGPELCTFVAESFPPQCSGPPLAGWDWAAHPEHEDASGTKWGSFALTGTFDGTTFTVTDAIPAALYDAVSEPAEPDFETPCDEPSGGWTMIDPATTTQEGMDATFAAAGRLPGYAGAWIDQSINEADQPAPGEAAVNDPTSMIINVAVTEDVAGAEATLRETWGGALCVSEAAYTEAELNEIAMELQELPGVTTSSAADDVVQIGVLHDDGSLQAWADETYGEGRVEISATLVPAS
ncbi:hypothetical protein [Nocardioides sp.]|uniref:hypothetical protein n=1 Tax=Nocardioides sp. TaxID=35761 RepID=UPI002C98E701|nr:hypothetical protein [Nocardioides sp.]HXH79021.1 hypothetical protein [Nocardioides sp.]